MGIETHELPLLSPAVRPEDTIVIGREDMLLWVLCGDMEVIKITG